MKPYTVKVIDIDDILDELFFQDDIGSREQITEKISMANWTYGDTPFEGGTPYTFVDIDAFIEFLRDCVSNEIVGSLTNEQVNTIQALLPEDVYVNLGARR
jgi:hypothetical protein